MSRLGSTELNDILHLKVSESISLLLLLLLSLVISQNGERLVVASPTATDVSPTFGPSVLWSCVSASQFSVLHYCSDMAPIGTSTIGS